jgi:hypothetical protein
VGGLDSFVALWLPGWRVEQLLGRSFRIVFMEGAQRSPPKRELCAVPLATISRSRTAAYTLAVPKRSYTMKMISAVLIALALLSMAAPLYAFDAKSFYQQLDRQPN